MEGMEDCRFKAGDIVLITRHDGAGAVGTISEVFNTYVTFGCIEYCVVIEGDDGNDAIIVYEDDLILATPESVFEFDDDTFYGKPSFRIGDVVSNADDTYIVSDILNVVDKEDPRYVYELSPIGLDSDAIICEGASLEHQYHDNFWREYFTDIAQNVLPEWEGELYNFKSYRGMVYNSELRYEGRQHHTLPPDSMEHILQRYSIDGRRGAVLASSKNVKEIKKICNMKDRAGLDRLERSWADKNDNRNMRENVPDFGNEANGRSEFKYSKQERMFASEIGRLDSTFGIHREHYPMEMTNRQIMQAIREAYCNAKRIGIRKIRIYEGETRGRALYEGIARNGLTIRFWYDFDQDIIETAYPVRTDNNAKKH